MPDEFDFLESFGVSVSDAKEPANVYEKFILDVGNKITDDLRKFIKENVNHTGALAQSVVFFPTGALSFEIQADTYFKFMDQGVNAVGTTNHGSAYSFRTPYVGYNMANAIAEWAGVDLSHGFAMASSIKQKGLKPRKITESVITDKVLERIANDLSEATGLMFTINFEKTTEQWQ